MFLSWYNIMVTKRITTKSKITESATEGILRNFAKFTGNILFTEHLWATASSIMLQCELE